MGNKKGQTLIVVLGILAIFMIFIPTLVYLVQHEAKWTVKQRKTTSAFHCAETGIDRGTWKLRENSTNWDTVKNGGSINGYTGTTVYDVYAGDDSSQTLGQYKITISSGPLAGEITITSVGRDMTNNEVRAISAVFSKNAISSSLNVDGGISWKPNLIVHWGPVITYTSIDQAPSQWFPRKYSKGQIVGRATDPSQSKTDGKEYWAFQDLGTPPQVNLAYYKQLAKNSQIPTSSGGGTIKKATGSAVAIASPTGSGYFRIADNGSKIRFIDYKLTNTTAAIYCEGGMDWDNSSFLNVNAAIAEGSVDFNAKTSSYVATVPATAGQEYVKQKEMVPGYTYPGEGSPTYVVTGCGIHGFLYCGGTLNNAGGGSAMVGVIKTIGDVTVNTMTVYYDAAVAAGVQLSDSSFYQVSWEEIPGSW